MEDNAVDNNQWEAKVLAKIQFHCATLDIGLPNVKESLIFFTDEQAASIVNTLESPRKGRNGKITFGIFNHIPVAVKVPLPQEERDYDMYTYGPLDDDELLVENSFINEIALHYVLSKIVRLQTAAQVPNIIGCRKNLIVIEKLTGTAFRDCDFMSIDQFVSLAEYCGILSFLGVQHGDLHDGNILFCDKSTFVIDYGYCSCCELADCQKHGDDLSQFLNWYDCQQIGNDYEQRHTPSELSAAITIISEAVKKTLSIKDRWETFNSIVAQFKSNFQIVANEYDLFGSRALTHIAVKYENGKFLTPGFPMNFWGKQQPRINFVSSPMDFIPLGAWFAHSDYFVSAQPKEVAKAEKFLVLEYDGQMLTFPYGGIDTTKRPYWFERVCRNNTVYLLLVPNCDPVGDDFENLYSDLSPEDGIDTWANLTICGDEKVIYKQHLSFHVPQEYLNQASIDCVPNPLSPSSGFQRVFLLVALKLHSALEQKDFPGPMLNTFFPSLDSARVLMDEMKSKFSY